MRLLLLAAIPLCAALLNACATTNTSTETLAVEATDENISQWYTRAKPIVATELDVTFSALPLEIRDKGGMYQIHRELLDQYLEKAFKNDSREEILSQQIEHSLESIIALYDPFDKRIVIDRKNFRNYIESLTDLGHSSEQAAMTVIFHELVHAADDVNYDLEALHRNAPWKSLEQSSVIEGHAQKVTEKLCALHDCDQAFKDDEYYMSQLPALRGSARLLPTMRGGNTALKYVQGANFLSSLQEMEDGDQLVERAMRSAPGDVLSLFNAERYLDPAIHTSSKNLAELLASEETEWLSDWVNVPEAVFTQSSFPRSSARRAAFVKARSENLLGSAMSNFYAPEDSGLLPISIKLLQAKSAVQADTEAAFLFNDVRHKTSGMLGWSLKLKDINTRIEKNENGPEGAANRFFEATILDAESNDSTGYRVTILNRQDTVAEVSSFGTEKQHAKARKVAEGLLNIQISRALTQQQPHEQKMQFVDVTGPL